jgi:hypothetical protein
MVLKKKQDPFWSNRNKQQQQNIDLAVKLNFLKIFSEYPKGVNTF